MFTGLIEEIGKITKIDKTSQAFYLTIECSKVIDGLKTGDSIAVNGACQTVTEFSQKSFKVFASSETLAVTTFGNFVIGQPVNLERTLRLCDRLDGHIVSGHVDGIAYIKNIEKNGDTTIFAFETNSKLSKQIVTKGSVALDGISLTIAEIEGNIFKTAVIPHTYENTNLKYLNVSDSVNLETDLISKYVEKYLLSNNNVNKNATAIDFSLLERNGFL